MKDWELAYKDYKDGMKYKEIAEKYSKSINTVKSWKSRYWNAITDTTNEVGTKDKKVCTQKEKVAHKEEIPRAVIELNDNSNLTEQQKLFCLYYLQYYNATKAYQLAYGVDWKSANAAGPRLLVNVSVKEELAKMKSQMQSEVYADAKQLINELLKQANSDIGDYVDFNSYEYQSLDENEQPIINEFTGEPETYKISRVNLKDSSVVDTSLIQEVKKGKDGVSIKLVDKQRALLEVLKRLEVGGDDPTEFEDDGFLSALESEGEELWPSE